MTEPGESHRSFNLYKQLAFAALVVVAFAPSWIAAFSARPRILFAEPARQTAIAPESPPVVPVFEDRLVYTHRLTRFAHSPTLTETANGDLLLVWFGGTGEGRPSVGALSVHLPAAGRGLDSAAAGYRSRPDPGRAGPVRLYHREPGTMDRTGRRPLSLLRHVLGGRLVRKQRQSQDLR